MSTKNNSRQAKCETSRLIDFYAVKALLEKYPEFREKQLYECFNFILYPWELKFTSNDELQNVYEEIALVPITFFVTPQTTLQQFIEHAIIILKHFSKLGKPAETKVTMPTLNHYSEIQPSGEGFDTNVYNINYTIVSENLKAGLATIDHYRDLYKSAVDREQYERAKAILDAVKLHGHTL